MVIMANPTASCVDGKSSVCKGGLDIVQMLMDYYQLVILSYG